MRCKEICPLAVPPIGSPERKAYEDKIVVGKYSWLTWPYRSISLEVGDALVTVYRNMESSGCNPSHWFPQEAEPRCELPAALLKKRRGSVAVWYCPYIKQPLVSFKVESL